MNVEEVSLLVNMLKSCPDAIIFDFLLGCSNQATVFWIQLSLLCVYVC